MRRGTTPTLRLALEDIDVDQDFTTACTGEKI